MGKKTKEKKTQKPEKSGREKLEQKIIKLEKEIAGTRSKIHKLLAKSARMDVQDYVLKDRDNNDVKLSEMFGDKRDLILVHNMGKSCSYCTLWADGFSGVTYFMEKKAAFVVVSPDAPEVQKAFAGERGWKFKMYSGKDSTFIKDMGYVMDDGSYWPGASIFHKNDDGSISRVTKTYFGPGDDYCSVWHFFDLLPQNSND
jgi:predicted dithiol-disulfide oxidoreductase (DUF899 family)